MAWTYNPALSTAKDRVRLLIGDTDQADGLLSDEEISFLLSSNGGDENLAGAEACEALAAKFARQVDTKNGALSVAASQRYRAYAQRASILRERTTMFAEVFAGGLSRSGKASLDDDADLVQPRFSRGMFTDGD